MRVYTHCLRTQTHIHTQTRMRARAHTQVVSVLLDAFCDTSHIQHPFSEAQHPFSEASSVVRVADVEIQHLLRAHWVRLFVTFAMARQTFAKDSLHLWSMCEYTRALSFENFVYSSLSMGAMDGRTYLCIYVSIYIYRFISIYIYRYRYRYTFFN